jgi:hypothetical protein
MGRRLALGLPGRVAIAYVVRRATKLLPVARNVMGIRTLGRGLAFGLTSSVTVAGTFGRATEVLSAARNITGGRAFRVVIIISAIAFLSVLAASCFAADRDTVVPFAAASVTTATFTLSTATMWTTTGTTSWATL